MTILPFPSKFLLVASKGLFVLSSWICFCCYHVVLGQFGILIYKKIKNKMSSTLDNGESCQD